MIGQLELNEHLITALRSTIEEVEGRLVEDGSDREPTAQPPSPHGRETGRITRSAPGSGGTAADMDARGAGRRGRVAWTPAGRSDPLPAPAPTPSSHRSHDTPLSTRGPRRRGENGAAWHTPGSMYVAELHALVDGQSSPEAPAAAATPNHGAVTAPGADQTALVARNPDADLTSSELAYRDLRGQLRDALAEVERQKELVVAAEAKIREREQGAATSKERAAEAHRAAGAAKEEAESLRARVEEVERARSRAEAEVKGADQAAQAHKARLEQAVADAEAAAAEAVRERDRAQQQLSWEAEARRAADGQVLRLRCACGAPPVSQTRCRLLTPTLALRTTVHRLQHADAAAEEARAAAARAEAGRRELEAAVESSRAGRDVLEKERSALRGRVAAIERELVAAREELAAKAVRGCMHGARDRHSIRVEVSSLADHSLLLTLPPTPAQAAADRDLRSARDALQAARDRAVRAEEEAEAWQASASAAHARVREALERAERSSVAAAAAAARAERAEREVERERARAEELAAQVAVRGGLCAPTALR